MKYLGSKRRIAKDILPIILGGMKKGDYFVDAFCGGCNLLDKVPDTFKRIANDKNEYLIAMWKRLQQGNRFTETISRDLYVKAREASKKGNLSNFTKAEISWIGFMGSRVGRWFDGGYSEHEVKGRDYISEQIRNTLSQIPLLSDVDFRCGSYEEIELPPVSKTTIYCDIPYKGVTQYATSRNFDYERFYDWCREQHAEGYRVFVSEYEMPDDFKCIWQKQVTCTTNPTITKKRIEKLFML